MLAIVIGAPRSADDGRRPADAPQERLVWVSIPGPSGGGGGRAADLPSPPKPMPPPPPADAPAPPPIPTPVVDDVPQPLGAETPVPFDLASASNLGAIGPPTAPAGDGRGRGSGNNNGDGAGNGGPDGFGDGAHQVGNGVTPPFPLTRASGKYTPEAVLARAQGTISVECVVETDGQCGDVRIVRAFNPSFGLHTEALNAARRWRFRPGMRDNMPVPVLIRLEIEFRIH